MITRADEESRNVSGIVFIAFIVIILRLFIDSFSSHLQADSIVRERLARYLRIIISFEKVVKRKSICCRQKYCLAMLDSG